MQVIKNGFIYLMMIPLSFPIGFAVSGGMWALGIFMVAVTSSVFLMFLLSARVRLFLSATCQEDMLILSKNRIFTECLMCSGIQPEDVAWARTSPIIIGSENMIHVTALLAATVSGEGNSNVGYFVAMYDAARDPLNQTQNRWCGTEYFFLGDKECVLERCATLGLLPSSNTPDASTEWCIEEYDRQGNNT